MLKKLLPRTGQSVSRDRIWPADRTLLAPRLDTLVKVGRWLLFRLLWTTFEDCVEKTTSEGRIKCLKGPYLARWPYFAYPLFRHFGKSRKMITFSTPSDHFWSEQWLGGWPILKNWLEPDTEPPCQVKLVHIVDTLGNSVKPRTLIDNKNLEPILYIKNSQKAVRSSSNSFDSVN